MAELQVKREIPYGYLVFLFDAVINTEDVVCAPPLSGDFCVCSTPNGFTVEVPRLAAPLTAVEIVWDEIPIGSVCRMFRIFFLHAEIVE